MITHVQDEDFFYSRPFRSHSTSSFQGALMPTPYSNSIDENGIIRHISAFDTEAHALEYAQQAAELGFVPRIFQDAYFDVEHPWVVTWREY